MSKFKTVGRWWANKEIELVEIDGEVYALNGWNGDDYIDCWKCEGYTEASDERYTLRPVYAESGDGEYDITEYRLI